MICPGCGRTVGKNEKFCRYCGSDLSVESVQKIYCAQCGSELSAFDTFCGKCGAAVKHISPEDIDKTISVEEIDHDWRNYDSNDRNLYSYDRTSQTIWEEEDEEEELEKKNHVGLIVLIIVLAFLAVGTTVTAVCLFSDGDNFVKQLLHFDQDDSKNNGGEEQESVENLETNSESSNESSYSSQDGQSIEETSSQVGLESTPQNIEESGSQASSSDLQENTPAIIDAGGLSVESSSGENTSDYIMPDSSVRYLTEEELRSFSAEQLRIIRNEIYARKGRKFKDEKLQAYFNGKSWYNPTVEADDFKDDTMLNDIERANTKMIRKIEDEKK